MGAGTLTPIESRGCGRMDSFLTGFGVVLLAAAIVGGGMTASGVNVPVISSLTRQVLLAAFGGFLIYIGVTGVRVVRDTAAVGNPGPASSVELPAPNEHLDLPANGTTGSLQPRARVGPGNENATEP